MKLRKAILWIVAILVAGFLLLQVVPYGHAHDNPPVVGEPNWDSPQTRELAQQACFDCHSNETTWPWYSNVAPVSWLVQHDVDEGRRYLNFSNWNQTNEGEGREGEETEELGEVVLNGQMPPANYLITHPEAKLTEDERAALAAGLAATAGVSPTGATHEAGESAEHEAGE